LNPLIVLVPPVKITVIPVIVVGDCCWALFVVIDLRCQQLPMITIRDHSDAVVVGYYDPPRAGVCFVVSS